ncbi:MAG: hypothetical protein D3916_18060 [Candidatus Electrothrix sp. MAN1_4]|nr:hypothetical protein [Candidatus Electrothrix sp. MAN1_4]
MLNALNVLGDWVIGAPSQGSFFILAISIISFFLVLSIIEPEIPEAKLILFWINKNLVRRNEKPSSEGMKKHRAMEIFRIIGSRLKLAVDFYNAAWLK